MLTGAMIMASIGSPRWEMRELVAPDSRASSAVPGGRSCADKAKENRNIEIARILHFVWPLVPLIRVKLQFLAATGSRWLLLFKCRKVPQSIDHSSRQAVSSSDRPCSSSSTEKPETSYCRAGPRHFPIMQNAGTAWPQ